MTFDDKRLAEKITVFLEKYGKRDVMEPSEWSSPDAAMLEVYAKALLIGGDRPLPLPFSSWESGGYGPYISKESRLEHDQIMRLVAQRGEEKDDRYPKLG